MYESTFPLFKTGVCSVEYRVALQTSLAVKKHLRKEEQEWKGNRKRKKRKGRKELWGLCQDSIQCVQLKESRGLVTERERGLGTQADTLASLMP